MVAVAVRVGVAVAVRVGVGVGGPMIIDTQEQPKTLSQRLWEWNNLSDELDRVKAKEMAMRKELFGEIFTAPTEGVNKFELPGGWKLNATYKLDRKPDEALLHGTLTKLAERGVEVADLIKITPSLSVSAYKKLSEADRKLMDEALIIKPASPSMELIAPKDGKAHGKVELTRS